MSMIILIIIISTCLKNCLKKGKSCLTNIFSVYKKSTKQLTDDNYDIIHFDFKVAHLRLLKKLKAHGIQAIGLRRINE